MWRLFQNLPRVAARQYQWNSSVVSSAPQAACSENCTSVQHHGIHTTAARPVIFDDRNSKNWYYHKRNRSNGNKKKKSKKTTDCDWDEWMRSFTHCWSAYGQPRVLEAVGYGTAVLLGLHLSQYYKLWNCHHMRKHAGQTNGWCMGYHLHQLALVWPMVTNTGLSNYMLPEPVQSMVVSTTDVDVQSEAGYEKTNDVVVEDDVLDFLQPSLWLEDLIISTADQNILKFQYDAQLHNEAQLQNDAQLQTDAQLQNGAQLQNKSTVTTLGRCSDPLDDGLAAWSDLDQLYRSTGHNLAAFELAKQGNFPKAVSIWQKSSELASSSYNLGICHELGLGVERNVETAASYYQRAAVQGHHRATYNLARLYLQGCGVSKDLAKARELLQQAAQNGVSKAQCDLGVVYATIEENMERAVPMFELAAKEKDGAGLYNLGMCYQYGWGVDKNLCKAGDLYSQAAHLGHTLAQRVLAQFFQYGLGGLPVNEECAKMWSRAAEGETSPTTVDVIESDHEISFEKSEDLMESRTPLEHHLTAREQLVIETSIKKSCFYIETSDSDSSGTDSEISSDLSDSGTSMSSSYSLHGNGTMPNRINMADADGMNPNENKSKEFVNQNNGKVLLHGNENEIEFPIEEGHFGEFLPKLPMRGSFGNLPKYKKKLKWNRQTNSISDFRLYHRGDLGGLLHGFGSSMIESDVMKSSSFNSPQEDDVAVK